MTYLEVHTDRQTHRWEIKGLPKGKREVDFRKRVQLIEKALLNYQENMSYAFKDAKVYIVHQSNFKPWRCRQLTPRKK